MEAISYHAISASVDLAAERGRYPSFEGSLWSKGILPIDSIKLLEDARRAWRWMAQRRSTGRPCANGEEDRHAQFQYDGDRADGDDLQHLRRRAIDRAGLPEPLRQIEHVRRLHGGERPTGPRPQGARPVGRGDGLRPEILRRQSVGQIDRVPDDLKALYATAFEIDSAWLIEAASRRQKWIDQAQSLNLYIANPSRQEARRALPAGVAGAQDDLLPALALGHPCREIDTEGH
jgi:ribonucleoside-diphosphate reductase alpha chain